MRTLIKTLALTLALSATCTAFGAGGGSMPTMPERSSGSASRDRKSVV